MLRQQGEVLRQLGNKLVYLPVAMCLRAREMLQARMDDGDSVQEVWNDLKRLEQGKREEQDVHEGSWQATGVGSASEEGTTPCVGVLGTWVLYTTPKSCTQHQSKDSK